RLLADEGVKVGKGQRIAEGDPYTPPITTEKGAFAHYVALKEAASRRQAVDEATGISSKVVIDWKQQPRGGDLRPQIVLLDDAGSGMTLANGLPAGSFLPADALPL